MSVQAITAVRGGAEAFRAGTAAAAAQPAQQTQPAREVAPAQQARTEEAPRPATEPADPPPDAQAAFATSQYLVGLLAAQTGGATDHVTRPARITPERLSALVEFLESHVSHRTTSASTGSVDASA